MDPYPRFSHLGSAKATPPAPLAGTLQSRAEFQRFFMECQRHWVLGSRTMLRLEGGAPSKCSWYEKEGQ